MRLTLLRSLLVASLLAFTPGVPLHAAEEDTVTAAELMPLEKNSWPMKITGGPGAGESATLTLEALPGGAGWAMRLGDRNALRLHAAEDGAIEVSEVELAASGRRLVFDPPALLVPAEMSPEKTFERSGKVQVLDADSGEEKTSGTYEQTLPPPSRTTYELPSGKSEAFEISNKVKIETDWATVDLDTALGLSMEDGPVYRRLVSDVTKAAFFGEKTTRTIEQELGG